MRSLLSAFAVAIAAAVPLSAQTVTGRVVDVSTGQPVAAARVEIVAQGSTRSAGGTETDAEGRFTLTVRAPGDYRLQAERMGYHRAASPLIRLAAGQTFEFDLDLRPSSMQLEEVVVTARTTPPFRDPRARNFYRRVNRPGVRVVLPEEIEARRPSGPMTLMRSIPGTVTRSSSQAVPIMISTERPRGRAVPCVPTVYINGIMRRMLARLDDMVDPEELWAIEVYTKPQDAPSELPPNADPFCGVIAIWTREA